MIRNVVLALAILLAAVLPAHARDRGPSGHRGHFPRSHGRLIPHHERFAHFGVVPHLFVGPFGYVPYGYAPYPPSCWWQDGRWVDQVYVDRYGGSALVPRWVPGGWVCR
jgi:hypothetical protein